MNHYVLDIETGPLAREAIAHLKPAFEAPSNYKDPVKIAEKLAEQEAAWYERAALSPLTGRVLCIGIKRIGVPDSFDILEGDEAAMLRQLWTITGNREVSHRWWGHNLHSFDIPFLVRRSWFHRVPVPMATLFDPRGYVNNARFRDTMAVFQCGNRSEGFTSLDTVGRFFGMPAKEQEKSKHFADLYAKDREAALKHLRADLVRTEAVVTRMFDSLD